MDGSTPRESLSAFAAYNKAQTKSARRLMSNKFDAAQLANEVDSMTKAINENRKKTKASKNADAKKGPKDEKKARAKNKTKAKEVKNDLDGDDVPLVENYIKQQMTDNPKTRGKAKTKSQLNGDNFIKAVLNSNKKMMQTMEDDDAETEGEFAKSLRSAFGLADDQEKPKGKKRKAKKEGNMKKEIEEENDTPLEKKKKRKDKKGESLPPQCAFPSSKCERGSNTIGVECFEWITHPVNMQTFVQDFWENRPLHIKRGKPNYYKDLFSTKAFDNLLRDHQVLFGKNLDVTSYSDESGRETHNPEGRAFPPVVWDYYNNGCSIRMINPQTFDQNVWEACAKLQEVLGSMVGGNVYLTPPGTQGFAPHFDDVDVFILQIEGNKRWRLYEPRNNQDHLSRFSSGNFSPNELSGSPSFDKVLHAGDFLYLPRGTIHQANCLEDSHSLHITLSCNQLNTYGDLLMKAVPKALETAMQQDVEFRKGLPFNYLDFMGVAFSDEEGSTKRMQFKEKVKGLLLNLVDYMDSDSACDELGKRLMHDSLPPKLTQRELTRTVERGGERWNANTNRVANRVEIDPDTQIRLLRGKCVRLVSESDSLRIYFNVDNTREYQQMPPQFLDVDADAAAAIETLVKTYPTFIKVQDLQREEMEEDEKMRLVQDLWEKKLIMTREPLQPHYDD